MDLKKVSSNINNVTDIVGKVVTLFTVVSVICDFIGDKKSKSQTSIPSSKK